MKMKTSQAIKAYKVLIDSKFNRLDPADQIRMIDTVNAIRPISEKFESDLKCAESKFKDERFDEYDRKAQLHNASIQKGNSKSILTEEELITVNKYFSDYRQNVEAYRDKLLDTSVDIKFEKMSEDAYKKIIESNTFTLGQASDLIILK